MEENKKKKLFMIGMSVLLILDLVIGGTYAWFTLQLNGTKVNVLKAGTLSLILNDENSMGISQEKAVPMLDEVGETLDPYHFTLENHSDIASEYTIYLDDIDLETDETRMADSKVKYQLVKDGTKTTALLNTLGENPNRILDSGTIDGNATITYDLRLWIDENTGNEAMGQVVKTKIRVVATQSTGSTSNENILNVYRYSEENGSKCITGEESTCVELTERPATYEPGTIVKYKVNDTEEKYFYVMYDNNDGTLTMQQRENVVDTVGWHNIPCTREDTSKGPTTAIAALEEATSSWLNVKDQTYTMGVTPFADNAFTGCDWGTLNCATNIYSWSERTAKARMITAKEAADLGCSSVEKSCPVWMFNYLQGMSLWIDDEDIPLDDDISTESSKIEGANYGYWTMTAVSESSELVFWIGNHPHLGTLQYTLDLCALGPHDSIGVRPVIVIDK